MITVLDTTAFSAAMRREPGMLEFLRTRRPGDLATVPPVVGEIDCGIRRHAPGSRRRALLEVVTANLPHFSRFEGLACRHWTGRPG